MSPGRASISRRPFGTLDDGRAVDEYTLENGSGMSLSVINLGGIVTAVRVPDRAGRVGDVVLALPTLDDYVLRNPNFGTIVGRFANRISGARFVLDGELHCLATNDGPNTLHGGARGFGKRWWHLAPEAADEEGRVCLRLDYESEDGEEGFPGRLDVTVRYTLLADNAWRIDYRATCDRTTVVNLSHHDYFNLAGSGSALEQSLTLAASRYLAIDAHLIPVAIDEVADTPFDFRVATPIAARIRAGDAQLALARGYDHNWIIDREGDGLAFAARLHDAASGRVLDIETSEPGMQFYSGNFLDGSLRGAGGAMIRQGDGVCLEPQHYPDSPNRPRFLPPCSVGARRFAAAPCTD
ncbi:MAG TPA: aldose epimerase family protein, partial [Caldimonas sp.]